MDNTNQYPGGNTTPGGEENQNMPGNTGGRDPKEFQLHIPEEALRFGDEGQDTLQSFSDSYQKDGGERKRQQDKKQRKKDKKEMKAREKIKGRRNRLLFRCVWLSMIVMVSIVTARYLLVGVNDMLAVSRSSSATVSVELEKDCTIQDVANALEKSGAIQNSFFFTMYCIVTGADDGFGQGSYEVETNLDYEAIVNYLQSNTNRKDVVRITFPEGVNLLEIAQKLEENEVCTAEEVLEAANSSNYDDYDFVKAITNADERYYKLEGYLFPDTYDFYKGEDPKVALGKMINTCQTRFSKEMREKAEEMGYTIDEVLTLASIVQAEATDEKDMTMIAGILQNRLESGSSQDIYRLQCDSTVYYPYANKSQVPEDELENFTSTYDTYNIEGLPPGPICSPGLAAIRAVLEPSPNSAGMYYFCHDEEGKAYYASTASQHEANLRAAGLAE